MNDRLQDSWLTPIMFALSGVYLFGAIYAVLGWTGLQSVDATIWPAEALPFYGLTFLVGGASALAIARWRKWGVYGLIVSWIITTVVNAVYVGALTIEPTMIMALALVVLFAYELPRVWRNFR